KARDDFAAGLGCIGFCAGGRSCLLFACSSDRLDAAVDCWGGFVTSADMQHETTEARPTRVIDLVPGLDCPLLAVGGAEDQNPSPAVAGIRSGDLSKLTRQNVTLPGTVDSSPIYLHGVRVAGARRDVFLVTTSYGRALALDAATGLILWSFAPTSIGGLAGTYQ